MIIKTLLFSSRSFCVSVCLDTSGTYFGLKNELEVQILKKEKEESRTALRVPNSFTRLEDFIPVSQRLPLPTNTGRCCPAYILLVC